jgi:hypothetical protein
VLSADEGALGSWFDADADLEGHGLTVVVADDSQDCFIC